MFFFLNFLIFFPLLLFHSSFLSISIHSTGVKTPTTMDLITEEPSTRQVTVANIAAHGQSIRAFKSHLLSDHSYDHNGISLSDQMRLVSERLVLWTSLHLPTLHYLYGFENVLLPPSDPSMNQYKRKNLMRWAGKARLQRKVRRQKQRRIKRNPNIKIHEEIRDNRAFAAMKRKGAITTTTNSSTSKNNSTSTSTSTSNADVLPVIRVGVVCESLDPYLYTIHSPVSQHIRALLIATVSRFHVTVYVPQWHHNGHYSGGDLDDLKKRFYANVLPKMMDDYATMTKLGELSVQVRINCLLDCFFFFWASASDSIFFLSFSLSLSLSLSLSFPHRIVFS